MKENLKLDIKMNFCDKITYIIHFVNFFQKMIYITIIISNQNIFINIH